MQVHKMIRPRLETCCENIPTLGEGKEHLRFSGFFYLSFNRYGCATAFLRHVALTKRQPPRMHCKSDKLFFHNVSGYERPSTAKALTTQHQGNMTSIQHLGIQSILLVREVYRVNSFVCETSPGLFNKYMRSSDGLLCLFPWYNLKVTRQLNWNHIFSART